MKYFKYTFLLVLLLAIVGCGPSVTTTKKTNKDLSNYTSFAYLPNTNSEVEGKRYNDENINELVVETVRSQMINTGYSLDRDNPDLLVLISTKVDSETETTTDPVYARYPYNARMTSVGSYYNNYYYRGYNNYSGVVGYDTDTYSYKEGTLIINLIDRKTKETVWKGVASDNIYEGSTNGEISKMVDDIFKEYPMS